MSLISEFGTSYFLMSSVVGREILNFVDAL
jgi:hypothetical protein